MQFNTFLENHFQLSEIKKTSIREVILEHKLLSRTGKNESKLLISLAEEAISYKIRPILQWDILSTEKNFRQSLKILNRIPLKIFHAVRVQDLGAAQWIKQQKPNIPIQLILETGNHNLKAITRISEYFGKQLNRIILSTELSKSKLIKYSQILKTDCEILCVGRILLFYSPRKLISKFNYLDKSINHFEKNIFYTDQPQKIFPIIENYHGTFMFFHKDLFLLDFLPELKKSGLSCLRLDLRHINFSNKLIKKINYLITNFEKSKIDELKALWPVKITHGFFRANRTDLAIERIKNPYLNNNSENLVGFVIESVKDKYIALIARKDFACGDGEPLIGITPEGKKCTILTNDIKTSNGIPVNMVLPGEIYQVPHVKFVTAQTLIYKSRKS